MVEHGNGIRHPRLRRWFLVLLGSILAGLITYRWMFQDEPQKPSILGDKVSSSSGKTIVDPAEELRSADGSAKQDAHPLDRVLRMAKESLDRMQSEVVDYTATMVKRERVSGKLGSEAKMFIKIRAANSKTDPQVPIHVYLKFELPGSAKGREVIWVDGRNQGLMVAHEAGFLNIARANLDPKGTLAMMGNKYPITEIGLENLVRTLVKKGERDRALGDCLVEVEEGHEVDGAPCRLVRVTHPTPKPEFDFHIAEIMFDTERLLPLRYASYLWPAKEGEPPPLEEEYTFLDLKTNVGLTEADFDPNNKEYKFP